MKLLIGAALAASIIAAAPPALATHGTRDAGVNERQARLEHRLEQGRRSGELTRPEFRRLRHELREIERAEHYFRSDGWLSPRERSDLHARLAYLERVVYREKRDGERRYGFYNH
ncbi:MAG TPA: hypothetical protein VED01_25015 [Burkholderiales bacterium]|nr:hypothetical protein [Burkholderiales bacterium]